MARVDPCPRARWVPLSKWQVRWCAGSTSPVGISSQLCIRGRPCVLHNQPWWDYLHGGQHYKPGPLLPSGAATLGARQVWRGCEDLTPWPCCPWATVGQLLCDENGGQQLFSLSLPENPHF